MNRSFKLFRSGAALRGRALPSILALSAWFAFGSVPALRASDPVGFQLAPAAQAGAEGVFLNQVVRSAAPVLRLCDPPAWGKTLIFPRSKVVELAAAAGCETALANWTGAESVRISRRARSLAEAEALAQLKTVLQEQYVKERGELELRFTRPWTTLCVPDEPLTLKVLDLPTAGVTSSFIAKFQLLTAQGEEAASCQAVLQARIWHDVWVARAGLRRGDPVQGAELARERRDILLCRETPAEFERDDPALELAETVNPGALVSIRSIRPRTIIHRGQVVAALVQEGALAVSLKVEALEDGAAGQIIRARNPVSHRDLRGKVLDDQSILVPL